MLGVGLAGMASSMSAGDPMAASMKIAEDCMREDEEGDAGQYEGVEVLARMIDSGWIERLYCLWVEGRT